MEKYVGNTEGKVMLASPELCEDLLNCKENDVEEERVRADIIEGYCLECYQIEDYLSKFIEKTLNKGQTLILEGSHLEPEFCIWLMEKYHC